MRFFISKLTAKGPEPVCFQPTQCEYVKDRSFNAIDHGSVRLSLDRLSHRSDNNIMLPIDVPVEIVDAERYLSAYVLKQSPDKYTPPTAVLTLVDFSSAFHDSQVGSNIEFAIYGKARMFTDSKIKERRNFQIVGSYALNGASICWTRHNRNSAPTSYHMQLINGHWQQQSVAQPATMY